MTTQAVPPPAGANADHPAYMDYWRTLVRCWQRIEHEAQEREKGAEHNESLEAPVVNHFSTSTMRNQRL